MSSKRKLNFSHDENVFLTSMYEEFKEILDASHRDADTNKKKNEAWEKIISLHRNRFPHVARSREDLAPSEVVETKEWGQGSPSSAEEITKENGWREASSSP